MANYRARKTFTGDYKVEQEQPFWVRATNIIMLIIGVIVGLGVYGISDSLVAGIILWLVVWLGGSFLVGYKVGQHRNNKVEKAATEAAASVMEDIRANEDKMLQAYTDAGYKEDEYKFESISFTSSSGGTVSRTVGPVAVKEGVSKVTTILLDQYDMNNDDTSINLLINGQPVTRNSGLEESLRLKAFDVKPGDLVSMTIVLPAVNGAYFKGSPSICFLSK